MLPSPLGTTTFPIKVQAGGPEKAEIARPNVGIRRQKRAAPLLLSTAPPLMVQHAGTGGVNIPQVQLAGGKSQATAKTVGRRQRQRAVAGLGQSRKLRPFSEIESPT